MAEPRAPLEYNRLWQMRLWLFGVFFFLYAPLVALIIFSFNDSKRNVVWRGFTLDYYRKLFNNQDLMIAFANSLTIAFFATLISLVIGALAAVLLWRSASPSSRLLSARGSQASTRSRRRRPAISVPTTGRRSAISWCPISN